MLTRTLSSSQSCLVVALVLAAVCPGVLAQPSRGEQDIKHRRAAFTLIGSYFERLVQTAEGGRPYQPEVALKDAQTVEILSKLPWSAFAPGSEQGGGTKASPDIWLEDDRFQQLALDMQSKVSQVRAATQAGDLAQIKAAVGVARKSCGACHDVFRLK